MMNKPPALYHYCSCDKFYSIIKSNIIRLSDITNSNDYMEMMLLYDKVVQKAWILYSSDPFEILYENKKDKNALKELLEISSSIVDHEFTKGELSSFVLCFSENGDLLSQWRGYSNNGMGFSIGFNFESINSFVKSKKGIYKFGKVKYVNDEQIESLSERYAHKLLKNLKTLRPWIETNMTKDPKDVDGLLSFNFHGSILSLIADSIIYKKSDFSEEKEWRLYIDDSHTKPFIKNFIEETWIGPNKDAISEINRRIDFSHNSDKIVPFIELSFRDLIIDNKNPIDRIFIGPNNTTSICNLDIFLNKNNIRN